MKIQAISNTQQINSANFKGKNITQVHNVGKKGFPTLKAIPLAALLAMSPLTKTNATEIMNSAPIEATAQPQQNVERVISSKDFIVNNNKTYTVSAINTKDNSGAFDKITIKNSDGKILNVKTLVGWTAMYVSADEHTNKPMKFKSVQAEDETGNSKAFLDNEIVNEIIRLIQTQENKTEIKILPDEGMFVYCENDNGKHSVYSDANGRELVKSIRAFCDINDYDLTRQAKLKANPNANDMVPIANLGIRAKTPRGEYSIYFIDEDGNQNNFERVYIANEDFRSKEFLGITNTALTIKGEDKNLPVGFVQGIILKGDKELHSITDDVLVQTLRKYVIGAPENNTKPKMFDKTRSEELNLPL